MKIYQKINEFFRKIPSIVYIFYDKIITILELFLKEVLRIIKIISHFFQGLYTTTGPLFSPKVILKSLACLALLSKIVVTFPLLPIPLELITFAKEYIDTLLFFSAGAATVLKDVLETYKDNKHTVLENESLQKKIQELEEQKLLNEEKAIERAIRLHEENSYLKAKIILEQEKNNLLTSANNEFTHPVHKEGITTRFDRLTRWLSISSSITNLGIIIYRFASGDLSTYTNMSDVKSLINELLKLVSAFKRSHVTQTAENKKTPGAPNTSPEDVPFKDLKEKID